MPHQLFYCHLASCSPARVFCTAVALLALIGCGSGSESAFPEINNELLVVSLEPDITYEGRVRAISERASSPWSTTFLIKTDPDNSEAVAVTYIDPELIATGYIFEDEIYDPLAKDHLGNLVNDGVQPTVDPAIREFNGVPMFSWDHDNNAEAYEIEIVQADTLHRVGVFQYAESSVCIEGKCQIVLENTRKESMDLPPIPVIAGTVVQGEAPYLVTIPSPVADVQARSEYSHAWSIEGRFHQFPDSPEFQYNFTESGSHIVNVVMTSNEGRTEYAYATVNIAPSVVAGGDGSASLSGVSAALSGVQAAVPNISSTSPIAETDETQEAVKGSSEVSAEFLAPQVVSLQSTGEAATPDIERVDQVVAPVLVAPVISVSLPEESVVKQPVLAAANAAVSSPSPQLLAELSGVEPVPAASVDEGTISSSAIPTASSVQVDWQLPAAATGQIAWGFSTDALDQTTVKEASFNYSSHSQTIAGLSPSTQIYFRVFGEFESGTSYSGQILSATTEEAVVVSGWDDSMPLGGRAIGVVTYGITTGNNTLVSHKHSRRFMATRSGSVKSFGYLNRTLTAGDIERRAVSKRTTEPVWYEIQQTLGNDPKRGGYMLNNSYSVGNGGLQEVTLQTDSGSPEHLPTGVVVATAEPFVPFDLPEDSIVFIDFKQDANVQAGQIYHLVFNNLNPPNTALRQMTAAEAQNAPVDKGAISLDGTHGGYAIDPDERHGPFLGNIPATLIKKSASSSWQMTNINAFYSLVYADDKEVGEMYAHIHGQGAYSYYVEGNRQLRQEFTWNYPNVSVDRVVTRFGHIPTANGQSMNIVVKNQSEVPVATASIQHDPELKAAASDSSFWVSQQTRHAVSYLSSTVELVMGEKYYVEYSAPSGAGFKMSPALDSNLRSGSSDWTIWDDAMGMQSTDGGNTWVNWNSFITSDMAMYLIPVGMPTRTPIP